jgi:hypothetical protein
VIDSREASLRREERVILALIRDLTAPKQARLREIRAELRSLCGAKAAKPAER